jgi:hypothetical protein
LIPISELGGALLTAQDAAFDELITSTAFLPRIQVFGSTSEAVKEEKIGQGRLGLVRSKDDIEDLGKELDCIPLSYRLKAMQISGDEVISVYDHTSDEFKRIQGESEQPNSGAMYGVEFLLYLPQQGEYVTFFLNSKSSRREAKPMRGLIGKGATVEVVLIKTKRYSWHAPKVKACSTPFQAQLPIPDAMGKEIQRFLNPPNSTVEKASKEEAAATSSDRR